MTQCTGLYGNFIAEKFIRMRYVHPRKKIEHLRKYHIREERKKNKREINNSVFRGTNGEIEFFKFHFH